MPYHKQVVLTFTDLDGFRPLLMKLAQKRAPGSERATYGPIIRQAIREYLERERMLKPRGKKLSVPTTTSVEEV